MEKREYGLIPYRFTVLSLFTVNAAFLSLWTVPLCNHILFRADPIAPPDKYFNGMDTLVKALWTTCLFELIVFMEGWCIYRAMVVDPGSIPEWWKENPDRIMIQERLPNGDWKVDAETGYLYPDRAHKCRMADNRIILKMDHFCPWINRVIGFYNYKHFWLSIFYACLGSWVSLICFVSRFIRSKSDPGISLCYLACVLYASIFVGTLTLLITVFFGFHVYLLVTNQTTIELMTGSNRAYDLGCWLDNVAMVMGTNPHIWLLPIGTPYGDGLYFPRKEQPLLVHRE